MGLRMESCIGDKGGDCYLHTVGLLRHYEQAKDPIEEKQNRNDKEKRATLTHTLSFYLR